MLVMRSKLLSAFPRYDMKRYSESTIFTGVELGDSLGIFICLMWESALPGNLARARKGVA